MSGDENTRNVTDAQRELKKEKIGELILANEFEEAVRLLTTEKDEVVVQHGIRFAFLLRETQLVDGLTVLLGDARALIRAEAAFALGRIRDPRAAPALRAARGRGP